MQSVIEEREFGRFLFCSRHGWSSQNLVSSLLSLSAPAEAADCEEEDELACRGVTNTIWLFSVCKHASLQCYEGLLL